MVIAGPTAVGKTDLAIRLAKHYNTVILSADSRQFYRELNIGTAKPTAVQLQEAPHHFINTKTISELYGAGHFEKDAIRLLEELFLKHDLVIMTGGSGLYIDAVLHGVDDFEEVPAAVRDELNKEYESRGLSWLQEALSKEDPEYHKQADINNPQRLIRALEVTRHFKKPYSFFLKKKKAERNFIALKIFLNIGRSELYKRIDDRVDAMIARGLVDEARSFAAFRGHNALKTVGYKEIYEYLDGRYDLETAIAKIKQHTRNYAKRQITWFRNRDRFIDFSPMEPEKIISYINSFVK